MLVEVIGLVVAEGGVVLAEVRTPVGAVTVKWCDEREPSLGAHQVEWELDVEFRWGQDVLRAEDRSEWLSQNEHEIAFRGRLSLAESEPPLAHVELAGAVIDLGHVEGVPTDLSATWVELRVPSEKVALYPCLT
ncbi:hypothetical protein GCM10022247_07240 [Allokutzneria multivorans]|uniref:Uncharacterized protein n=1 Tax=Allokutzneria multivorans TaxID=1142134 RepID=A0ABP7R0V2_9PSEU